MKPQFEVQLLIEVPVDLCQLVPVAVGIYQFEQKNHGNIRSSRDIPTAVAVVVGHSGHWNILDHISWVCDQHASKQPQSTMGDPVMKFPAALVLQA